MPTLETPLRDVPVCAPDDLFDHLVDGGAVLDSDGVWLRANAAMGRLLKAEPEGLVGTHAHHSRMPGAAARIDAALADLPAWPETLRDIALAPAESPACDIGHLRWSLTPLSTSTALLQVRDDSAFAALQASQQMLAFGISHELRAPVRTIEQFARRLRQHDGAPDPQALADHLQRIHAAAGNAGTLIDGLLETLQAGRTPKPAVPVDISLLGDWICAELQDADPQRQARIRIAPDLWAMGDEHAYKQMLGKLLHNAWKFSSGRDAVEIELDGRRDGDRLQLRLSDRGRGFDMRYADRLFVPFRRLHSAEEGAGHGLGLVVAQQLAHAFGGRIRVTSEMEVGTTFHLDLPAVPDKDPRQS